MSAPRPRPTLKPCARCGATCFVRVSPLREHGVGGEPVPMAVAYLRRERDLGPFARAVSCVGPKISDEPMGSYTVVLCSGCGAARFYARDLDDTLEHAAVGACADCGERGSFRVERVKTRGRGGLPSELRVLSTTHRRFGFSMTCSLGHFSAFVCRGCGRTTWIAEGIRNAPSSLEADACQRCATTTRFLVDPVNEDGATLRVLYDRRGLDEHRVGRFSLAICTGCGVTDWSAHDVGSLVADDSLGVAALHAGEGHEGPYR